MNTSFKRHLLSSTLLLGFAAVAAPAFAQDQATAQTVQSADGEVQAEGEAIVVTGSRIRVNSIAESPSPLQVVGEEVIEQSGVVNIQEVLLQNPVFGTPGISRTNSNFSTASAGVATVDLRNLGTARTLVLVNGRRFVSGVPGSSAVDLNVIPTQFVDRIDVLTGGASAVYGSDAVAGVVNIITKNDFEGIELFGRAGLSEEGDDRRLEGALTFGGSFGDDRGRFIGHMGYSDQGAVFSRDRSRSAVDQISTALITGDPADFFNITAPFFSSFAPQGRFFRAPGVTAGTFNANNQFITGFSTNGSATRAADGFNRSAFRTIAVPTERYLGAFNAGYDITDNIEVYAEFTYAKTRTETELEPFPLDSVDVLPATGGFFNIENRQLNAAGAPVGPIVVNPFVPAGLLALLSDNNGDGLRDVAFTRRLSDVANRGNIANRDTFRVLAGLRGNLTDNIDFDAFYAFGQTTEAQISTGQFNVVNLRNALNVTRDAAGNLVCLDANARAEGCVPVNIFGRNTISPEALTYIDAPGFLNTDTRQKLAGATISGSFDSFWGADQLGFAIGGEYRKEFSDSAFDALQQAGLNGGNAIPRTTGEFDVKEAFAEVRVPIISRGFIEELTLSGAGRVSDYSTVGTVYSYNGNVDFAPFEGIRATAIWARTTRAPNINELFSPPSQNFPTGLQDPCVGIGATGGGTLGAVCRSFPGVNANIAANGTFTINQADIQGVSGFDRGNPNLSEETGDSFTARLVVNPVFVDALRNLTLTATYYNIRIKDAIVATPRQFILDQCFGQGNTDLCQFVTRRPTAEGANSPGSLDEVDSGVTNSGGLKQRGLDFTANFFTDFGDTRLTLTGSYTHLLEFYSVPLPGADRDQIKGEVGAATDRFFASANLDFGVSDFTLRATYIGESYLDDQFTSGFDLEPRDDLARIAPVVYLDAQARFDIDDNIEVNIGVNNLLDEEPPLIISGLPGNVTGTETDAGTYDPIGRRYYVGATLKF